MKTSPTIFVLLLALVLCTSCKSNYRNTDLNSVGLIIGLDKDLCVCCGNWIIKIDSEQNPYQFLELPKNSGIDLENAVFPISVKLNWTESNSNCRHVIISEIVED